MTKEEVLLKMILDLELRGRSKTTIQEYVSRVRNFQDYFNKPAIQMREPEIREFLHYLLTEKKAEPGTVNAYNSAIRFLYSETLDIALNIKKIPRAKQTRRIPELPTKEELGYLFHLTTNLKYKAIFMTIYGSGLRISEAAHLLVKDIDSKNMRIFIRRGKGDRDRFALLPQKTLEILREYYKVYRPKEWLFVNRSGSRLTSRSIGNAFQLVVQKSGIPKHITVHTLRHCFATHLLNEGKNVFEIKKLLGHSRIDTTTWYLQLSDSDTLKLKSPLDNMNESQYNFIDTNKECHD